jgi:methylmalonyl-CoA mutase N-terminal domain/subunit
MRQFAGFGTPEETNARFKYLLKEGQTGLSVAYDLPALMGYDADSSLSEGEVGKCGVAVSSLADMEALFDGIPLERVTVSQTINARLGLSGDVSRSCGKVGKRLERFWHSEIF